MIVGIGTDIVEINRFIKAKRSFIERVFTAAEINYLSDKKLESMAGIFAAKESVYKCLSHLKYNLNLHDIEISHVGNVPFVNLHSDLLSNSQYSVKKVHVSISHSKFCAVAIAIAEN